MNYSYPNDPQEQISLDIVASWCRTCDYPTITDNELKSCPVCGDLIMYQENDGTIYTYSPADGKYEVLE